MTDVTNTFASHHVTAELRDAMRNMHLPMRGLTKLILAAGDVGLTADEIMTKLYGWDAEGGPDSGYSTVRARIFYLNAKKLRPIGWEIVNTERSQHIKGRYLIKKIADPIPNSERVRYGVRLSKVKAKIVDVVANKPGISCRDLSEMLYGTQSHDDMNTTRVHVCGLRKVLAGSGATITGVQGSGYTMVKTNEARP